MKILSLEILKGLYDANSSLHSPSAYLQRMLLLQHNLAHDQGDDNQEEQEGERQQEDGQQQEAGRVG